MRVGPLVHLIDGPVYVFRAYHAIPSMRAPDGVPTNAAYGYASTLLKFIVERGATHLAVAFDHSLESFRNRLYPAYKAQRGDPPEDLAPQFELALRVTEALGVPVFARPDFEADDLIATLASQLVGKGARVEIVTSDKDARQLIGPRVKLYNVRKNQVMDETFLLEDWGIRPDQVIDFQALVGDSVDNIPGVPLVGPKKAGALLQQYGDLEGVLANADKAPGAKIRENLKTYADQARVSQKLARLNTDLPL